MTTKIGIDIDDTTFFTVKSMLKYADIFEEEISGMRTRKKNFGLITNRYYINVKKLKEKFYFEKPSIERKEEIIEYLDEFVKYNSNINGSGFLDKIYEGYAFEIVLDRCLKMENEEYAKSINLCPGKTFLLIREDDNKIVGSINIRWNY